MGCLPLVQNPFEVEDDKPYKRNSLSVPSSNVRRKKCRLGCIRFLSPSRVVGGLEIGQGDLSQRARGPATLSHRFKLNMADPN